MNLQVVSARVTWFVVLLPLLMAAAAVESGAQQASGYRAHLVSVIANPPEGVRFRADLESYLTQLASSYRRGKKRPALIADQTFRNVARAQAIDMMLQGRSGHRSRSGHDFRARFQTILHADNTAWASGENAASDRHKGAADKTKAKRLFQSWVDSTGHRKNLLNGRYAYVSTGTVQRGNELWSVQIFWSEPITSNFTIQ